MSNKTLFLGLSLALGVYGASNSPVLAQPDANNGPKANNPANLNMGGGGGRGGRGGGGGFGGGGFGGGFGQQMTADQLRQIQAQQTEMRALNIRQQLTFAGFTDEAVQSAVVDYYKAQEAARPKLLEQWQKISQAVRDTTTTDTQMATLLNDFRAAVEDEKSRRDTAYKTLSTKVDLPKKPKLDALLMTMSLTGDEASVVGQANNNGLAGLVNLLGNMGGMGGGMGGFGGGPGGGMGGPGGGGGFGGGPGGGMGGPGGGGGNPFGNFGGGQGRGGGPGGRGGPGGGQGGDMNGPPPPPDDMGGGPPGN